MSALTAPAMSAADVTETISEILVTATRRPALQDEISAAVAVVDSEALEGRKLVTDSLAAVVGASLQQTTPGQGAVIIRGLKGSSILHLVDGMRLNNAIFRSAPTQYFALVPATAVDRIEVVRGTPTSLYGSDAVGGVVQLVSRVPRFDGRSTEYRGDVQLAADSAELGKSVRGTFDAGNSKFSTSLSAEYLQTGNRKIGGGERIGPSGYEAKAGRALLALYPDDQQTWLLDLQYHEQPSTPRVDELVPGFGQDEPSSSEFFFAPNRRMFVHGKYARTDGWFGLDWNADIAWQHIDDDRITRDYLASNRRRESNESDLYGIAVNANKLTDNGSWIVGAEYYFDEVGSSRTDEDLTTGQVVNIASRFPDGSTVRQAAAFANISRDIGERHILSGGLRASTVSIRLPATPVIDAATVDDDDISGDIGWISNVTDSWQLIANLGFGFRAPNVFDIGALGERPGNRFNVPNTDLESEKVTQFDTGVRYTGDRASLEIMVYSLRYKNRITSVSTGDVTASGRDVVRSENAASSDIRGVEVGGRFDFTDKLWARLTLGYTWGEQQFDDLTAEPADRIPPFGGQLITGYLGDTVDVEGWLNFAAAQDRLSARDVRDTRIDPTGSAGWGDVGVRARWRFHDGWTTTIALENLLDKRYRVHGSGLESPGRNLVLMLNRRW